LGLRVPILAIRQCLVQDCSILNSCLRLRQYIYGKTLTASALNKAIILGSNQEDSLPCQPPYDSHQLLPNLTRNQRFIHIQFETNLYGNVDMASYDNALILGAIEDYGFIECTFITLFIKDTFLPLIYSNFHHLIIHY